MLILESRCVDQERRLVEMNDIKDRLDEMEQMKLDKLRFETDNEK